MGTKQMSFSVKFQDFIPSFFQYFFNIYWMWILNIIQIIQSIHIYSHILIISVKQLIGDEGSRGAIAGR